MYKFGDIVLANVVYSDGSGAKKRPCMITQPVGGGAFEVVIVTSQQASAGGKMPHEVIVTSADEKKAMGLWKDSRLSMRSRDLRIVKTSDITESIGQTPRSVIARLALAAMSTK